MENTVKLYSQKAISISTYFGGPLAAGILIRQNFINLGKEKEGLNALIISAIATFIVFAGIFSIPEPIIDKIPNSLIPLVYTGIIYLIVERVQGKELKELKEAKGEFYSNWKAFAVGLVTGLIVFGSIFGYAYLQDSSWDVDLYNTKMETHANNETEALKLYELLDNGSKGEIKRFINNKGIPIWKENLDILESAGNIENIPEEHVKQVQLLTEYTNMRIEAYELILKAVIQESSEFDREIIKRHNRIDEIIESL